jgi:hypothetical protein
MGSTQRRAAAATAALALAVALGACDSGSSSGGQPAAQQQGGAGALLSVAQAELAARQWWAADEQALVNRDANAIANLDAAPLAQVMAHQLEAYRAVGAGLLRAPRTPQAVRVYVPEQESYPLRLLAVFDVPDRNGTGHQAELLVQPGAGAALVAEQSAVLDAREPAFDVDAAGVVRTVAGADQQRLLGRTDSDLSPSFDAYMSGLTHGHPPTGTPAFAAGRHTSDAAAADAAYLRDAPARSNGLVASAEVGYVDLQVAEPVFALAGGGGFTLFASQRDQVLHPAEGKAFSQDTNRHNWGIDLPPGTYPQITEQSVVMVAALLPAGGAPVQVLGVGGGVESAS